MARERAFALLLDFDGVVRVFDPAVCEAIERAHGIPPGAVLASALSWERVRPVITGEQSHADWLDAIASDVGDRAAVDAWWAYRGRVVPEVLDLVREVRAAGLPVGLATNATPALDGELAGLGIDGAFDAVVNSSVVGVHKPTREYFAAACTAVGTPPARCLFVDDSDRNVRGARAAGLSAYRWNGPADLPYVRAALAL
jgi:putative hydrolase of the HAD superfamily